MTLTFAIFAALLLQATPEEPRGSISGRVISAESGEGLRGVNVFLTAQSQNQRFGRNAVSGPDGAFILERLPGGSYTLSIHKYGYKPATLLPVNVMLEHNQERTGLDFKMHRPGVISGTVIDPEGLPVAGGHVTAFRIVWSDGRRRAVQAAKVRSDDRGRYRLFGLEAGQYVIGVMTAPAQTPEGEVEVSLRTYYPGGSRLADAVPVRVRWGQETSGIGVALRAEPSFTVMGRVLDALTGGPCVSCVVSVRPADDAIESEGLSARISVDGTYRVRGLTAGRHQVTIEKTTPPNTVASRIIHVTNRNLRDVDLAVGVETAIAGRVVFEGSPPEFDRTKMDLAILARAENGDDEQSRVKADLSFELRGLSAGPYRVSLEGMPPGGYLKALRVAGREYPGPTLELPERSALMQVDAVVAFDSGTIEGKLKTGGAAVVLFPQENQSPYLVEYRIQPDRSGSFILNGIAPGNYTAFAVPPGAPDLADPEIRRHFQNYGRSVALSRGQKATLELIPIPASEEP